MKSICLFLSAFCLCFCALSHTAFADLPRGLTSKQIIITEDGIMLNINGHLMTTESITYVGNGLYSVESNYYGQCGRCGYPRNAEGMCTNMNCDKNGPRRD